MKITQTQNQIAEQFISLVIQGTESLIQAGQFIANAIDEHGEDIIELIYQKNKNFSPQFIRGLERVGRKKTLPQLFTSNLPGAKRLALLPLSIQEKHVVDPVPLLILGDKTDVLQVNVFNLSLDQATQVFARDHVRNEAEQRAWLEDRREKRMTQLPKGEANYKINGNKVNINGVEFTAKQLARILADIQK
jgi:hypothetical protein